jgi:DNA repair exonuclease SbcCD ATPase subunit
VDTNERRQLQEEAQAARRELDELKARVGGLGTLADMESLHRALDQERARAAKLDDELAALQANFTRHRREAADELHRVQAELREMSELYGEVDAARAAAAGRVGATDRELAALAEERDELTRALRQAAAQADALRAEVEEAQARSMAATHTHTEAQAEAGRDGVHDVEAMVAARAEELAQRWRAAMDARVMEAEALTLALRREAETHQATLAAVRGEYERQVAELQEHVATNRTRAVALLDDKEREIADLRVQLTRQASQTGRDRDRARGDTPTHTPSQTPTPTPAPPAPPANASPADAPQEPLLHQVQLQVRRHTMPCPMQCYAMPCHHAMPCHACVCVCVCGWVVN